MTQMLVKIARGEKMEFNYEFFGDVIQRSHQILKCNYKRLTWVQKLSNLDTGTNVRILWLWGNWNWKMLYYWSSRWVDFCTDAELFTRLSCSRQEI